MLASPSARIARIFLYQAGRAKFCYWHAKRFPMSRVLPHRVTAILDSTTRKGDFYMKRKIATGSAVVAFVAMSLIVAGAAAKADFSGKWVMDKTKSDGVAPGVEFSLNITQAGDKIEVETTVKSPQGERVVKDAFIADGKEVEFTPPLPPQPGVTGKGKRTTKWAADGMGLEVSEAATLEGPQGSDEISATRKWTLAADGKTLTIEMAFSGEQGSQKTKRVFVRQ
jgi:hypothetical protein